MRGVRIFLWAAVVVLAGVTAYLLFNQIGRASCRERV